jgi:hypothetical protein
MSLSTTPIVGSPAVADKVDKTLARYLVCIVCSGSAGVHAALVPDHYREAGLGLAAAFALAAVALAVAAVLLRSARRDRRVPLACVVILCGVAAAYVLSRTTGIPFLIDHPEAPDPVGLCTTAAEVVAALLLVVSLRPARKDRS